MPQLDDYISAFKRLHTDRGRERYPSETLHRAPHKPFLLLSVLDLIAQGLIKNNFIEPSFDLVDTWNGYWNAVMPADRVSSMAYPFYYMKSEGFWHLVPKKGFKVSRASQTPSMAVLRETCTGALLDEDLFAAFCDPESRERLRAALVTTCFASEIQAVVAGQGYVNLAAYAYAQDIIAGVQEKAEDFSAEPREQGRIRDQGFRKAVVTLYDHRCALCGIRILTPDGHTVVEAAHIVPWSESHNDFPTNGLCLCRLCHWGFDEGLMGVGKAYQVMVSKRVRTERNMPGHILTLEDRPIFKPGEEQFWPGQDNLERHREKCFA